MTKQEPVCAFCFSANLRPSTGLHGGTICSDCQRRQPSPGDVTTPPGPSGPVRFGQQVAERVETAALATIEANDPSPPEKVTASQRHKNMVAAIHARNQAVISKLHENEPYFVLRAQDRMAPATIQSWIAVCRSIGVPESKLREVEQVIEAMHYYQEVHGCKLPD